MSFYVAAVCPDHALVASDTRLRVGQDGLLFYHRDDYSKIAAVPGAWIAGGTDPKLMQAVLGILNGSPISDLEALRVQLQQRPPYRPHGPSVPADVVWVLQEGPHDLTLYVLDLEKRQVEGAAGSLVDALLPWTDGDEEAVDQCLQATLTYRHYLVGTRPPLGPLIRRTAQLFREVYEICGPEGSVSDEVEIGVLEHGGAQRRIGPLPAADVATMTDLALETRLEPAVPRGILS